MLESGKVTSHASMDGGNGVILKCSTYRSSSKEDGIGSAPSTVEGIGACRDMVDCYVRCMPGGEMVQWWYENGHRVVLSMR